MIKTNLTITIETLLNLYPQIDFPEYQREPSVWELWKKQRLIDSILRDIDIASIYLFKKGDSSYDCIDGRQRINAILSFLGENDLPDQHNKFSLKIFNEIFEENTKINYLNNLKFEELTKKWKEKVLQYEINIVEIDKVDNQQELNLMFLRLQLGSILNSGEKLHAMSGDMREAVFNKIGKHKFFNEIKIPYRRYAREQVAAQLALNFFTKQKNNQFHSSRYIDLQDFLKEYSKFSKDDENYMSQINCNLNNITKVFGQKLKLIKNRAIAVSVFLFVSELINEQQKENNINMFVSFFEKFILTLKWQISEGLDMDREYQNLLKFQRYVTQAAGEKYAIENRHKFWTEYFEYYVKEEKIKGDKQFSKRTGTNPDDIRFKLSNGY